MSDSFDKTLRGKHFDEVFTEVTHTETLGLKNPEQLRLFHLNVNNNAFSSDKLEQFLRRNIGLYVFSRAQIEEYNIEGDAYSVGMDALDIMKRNGNPGQKGTGNDLGEILLYVFLEQVLGAPKIMSKVELQTRAKQYGSKCDGIHLLSLEQKFGMPYYHMVFGTSSIVGDMKKAVEEVNTLADQCGLHVDAHEKVENLSVGTKQRVEILKALYRKADILILDEPTAVLTPQEVSDLFRVLRKLKESGKTIIIITHKLKETLELADTVTVLRKGQVISSLPVTKEMDQAQLAELMVGRIVSLETEKKPVPGEHEVVMALQNATLTRDKRNLLDDVNLEIRSGEILGIAGVEGNGQTELIDVLTGLQRLTGGHVVLGGKQLTAHRITPRFMLEAHVGHIPEDRGKRGFVAGFTIAENIVLGYHRNKPFAKHGIINRKARDEFANRVAKQYDVRMDSINDTVGSLSGGNQQKVIIGRVFAQDPRVIIAAQPTRGVDIGAIEYIHSELVKMRDAGKAVLLISADLDELMRLSDKIAVLYDGRIVDRRDASEYDERTLGALMTGHTPESMEKEVKQA